MSSVVRCPECGARRRFESYDVGVHEGGGMYMYPPVTRTVECPCGRVFRAELYDGPIVVRVRGRET